MHHRISAKALSKNDNVFFKSMLQLVQLHLNATWEFDENANIVLVDIEQLEGKIFWDSQPIDKLLIAYARQNSGNADWFLQKPIRVQPLIKLLNTLATTESIHQINYKKSALSPITPALSPNPMPVAATKTIVQPTDKDEYFEPSFYLLGLLQSVLQEGQPRRFSCTGFSPLYVLPSERLCFTAPIHMNQLNLPQKMLYSAKVEYFDSTRLSAEIFHTEVEKYGLKVYNIDTVLWLTTLSASQGRLLNTYSHYHWVRLKQWPNFAILPHQSLHMNLSAFMLRNTIDITQLETIAQKTRVGLPDIKDFLNACQVIGLMVAENAPVSVEKDLPEPQRNLFKTILKHLLRQ